MGSKRVLIVEDKKRWRDILRTSLQKMPQKYSIATAATYSEAIERLQEEQFALVTMDIDLVGNNPDEEDGLDLIDYITTFCESTKIIVVSGSDIPMKKVPALLSHRCLPKDLFSRKEFIASVSEILKNVPDSDNDGPHPICSPAQLHQKLESHFSDDELQTLCLYLDIDYDDLSGENKSSKARELIIRLKRRNDLSRLTDWLAKNRPDIEI